MKQTLLNNLFLRTIYREGSQLKHRATERIISEDYRLREEFMELRAAAEALPQLRMSPPDSAIQAIIGYSLRSPMAVQA